jgi:hypothetical protein
MEAIRLRDGGAIVIGRTLAACVHPYAAWRASPLRQRLVIASGYFAAGFVSVLAVMLLRSF